MPLAYVGKGLVATDYDLAIIFSAIVANVATVERMNSTPKPFVPKHPELLLIVRLSTSIFLSVYKIVANLPSER